MPLQGEFTVRSLDCFLWRVLCHAQDLVVVLLLGGFGLLLGELELLVHLGEGRVERGSLAVVSHSFFPFFHVLVDFSSFDEGFDVLRLHLEAQVESLERFFVLRELHLADRFVQTNGGVVGEVQWIDLEARIKGLNCLRKIV